MNLFRKKTIDSVRSVNAHSKLEKRLGAMDLMLLGIGAVIGIGIFVLTGIQAATAAGPAVTLSFILAGVTCIFVALAYTEIASAIPSAGGAYTFAYISLGEVFAWILGWISIIQLSVASATVASGWSGYMMGILAQLNIHLPHAITHTPSAGGIIDLPASLICVVLTSVLIRGVQASATFNAILVVIKLAAIFTFLVIAAPYFDLDNWGHFDFSGAIPEFDGFMPFGFGGVTVAAGALFMAYTGFDAVANAAEECKNPGKDVTFGLIGSLLVCIVLYVAVAGMLTGIAPYAQLNNSEPLAYALKIHGSHIGGALVAAGGIAGMTTVILVQAYAQSRIFLAMSRDGLLPKYFSKIHPTHHTPYVSTLIIGCFVAIVSGFVPIAITGNLASMATMIIFTMVVISTIILRHKHPHIHRPFTCPALWLVGFLAIASCGYLIISLTQSVGHYMLAWVLLGLGVYFLFGKKNSNSFYKP